MMERTYRICDVVNEEFLRFPLTLLANPQYKEMSLEAKFVYALLLNRLTLSQKNGWINDDGEVYLVYTREEASATLNISYKKAIAAFRELIENRLLVEQRQGRGYPNLLYVLKAELADRDAAEFLDSLTNRQRKTLWNLIPCRTAKTAHQELLKRQFKICLNHISRPVKTAVQDLLKPQFQSCRNGTLKRLRIFILRLSRVRRVRLSVRRRQPGTHRPMKKSCGAFLSGANSICSGRTYRPCFGRPSNGCIIRTS